MSQLIQGSNVLQFETTLEMRQEDVVSRNQVGEYQPGDERRKGGLALDSEEFLPGIRSLFLHNVGITISSWNEMD